MSFTSVGDKDTLANVVATGEFVVNLATEPLLDQVNDTSARFGPDVDEAEALGIGLEPSDLVAPPRVVDSPASLECTLHSTHELGDSTLVLGRVAGRHRARRRPGRRPAGDGSTCSRSPGSGATSGGCRPR